MHGSIRISMSTAEPPEMVLGNRPMVPAKVIPGSCGWSGAGLLDIPIRWLSV
jgi:hypothetical protein